MATDVVSLPPFPPDAVASEAFEVDMNFQRSLDDTRTAGSLCRHMDKAVLICRIQSRRGNGIQKGQFGSWPTDKSVVVHSRYSPAFSVPHSHIYTRRAKTEEKSSIVVQRRVNTYPGKGRSALNAAATLIDCRSHHIHLL